MTGDAGLGASLDDDRLGAPLSMQRATMRRAVYPAVRPGQISGRAPASTASASTATEGRRAAHGGAARLAELSM